MTKADAGTYTCVAENPFGKANASTHVVVTGERVPRGSLLGGRAVWSGLTVKGHRSHGRQGRLCEGVACVLVFFLMGESRAAGSASAGTGRAGSGAAGSSCHRLLLSPVSCDVRSLGPAACSNIFDGLWRSPWNNL